MILNHEEIKEHKIIEDYNENNFSDGSYNLTISHVIDMDNQVSDGFNLNPQGMVYVVFKEKIKVPKNVIGFAHVKTSLTRQGIMATNIGIIDTNYEGYISTLLINFGKTPNYFGKGQSALRITFSNIKEPKSKMPLKSNNIDNEAYISKLKLNIARLDERFLNLNAIEEEVNKNVTSNVFAKLTKYVIVFTIAGALTSIILGMKSCTDKKNDTYISNYEAQLKTVTETNNLLLQKLEKMEYKLDAFKDSLHKVNKNKDKK